MNSRKINKIKTFQSVLLSFGVLLHTVYLGVNNYLIFIAVFLISFCAIYFLNKNDISGLKDRFRSNSFYAYSYMMFSGVIFIMYAFALGIRTLFLK